MSLRHVSLVVLIALLMGMFAAIPAQADDLSPQAAITLTLLHNNDGESSLDSSTNNIGTRDNPINLPIGGVAAFKTMFDNQVADAQQNGNAVIGVYAGDAFLASATLRCSEPFDPNSTDLVLDAVAQRQIAYDAHILGNHEFDFNPDFLERFIRDFEVGGTLDQPFLSANLDFSGESGFDDLTDTDGLIDTTDTPPEPENDRVVGKSLIIEKEGELFGIVGATTPRLENISTPRNVTVTADINATAAAVQAEIDELTNQGVNKIILVSHLQSLDNDKSLINLLTGVDVAVGGGGDELLLNKNQGAPPIAEQYLPGTRQRDIDESGDYPTTVKDAAQNDVLLVTAPGSYQYLGRLDINFTASGEVGDYNVSTSYPRRVIPESDVAQNNNITDIVASDMTIENTVLDQLETCLNELAADFVGQTEVALDVSRNGVRGGETNGGNLVADSFVYVYDEEADNVATRDNNNPVIAIQNGGGIRQNAPTGDTLEVGPISLLDTINVLPFDNRIVLVEDVSPQDLKAIFENSANALVGDDEDTGSGAFLQISGLRVRYDLTQPLGSRVLDLALDSTLPDGTTVDDRDIVVDGAVVADAPDVGIVTNSFTADGGDNYDALGDIPDSRKTRLKDANGDPLLYQQALELYLGSFPPQDIISTQNTLPTVPEDDPRYQSDVNNRAFFQEYQYLPLVAR